MKRSKSKKLADAEHVLEAQRCINLRDVGLLSEDLQRGKIIRSSQVLSSSEMQILGVKTVVDLRRMDRPCKKLLRKGNRLASFFNFFCANPHEMVPESLKPTALPHSCMRCMGAFEDRYGFPAAVVHADLIPAAVGLRIFWALPRKIRLRSLWAICCFKEPESVIAPAVANPSQYGYKLLYRTMLDHSKRGVARAMRVFADPDNYPVLVHCIHGKDRTGLIIMLLLLLCDIDPKAVIEDYMRSEELLRESRIANELPLEEYLMRDAVISATKETMEDTIQYMAVRYGSVRGYLKACGLQKHELSAVRVNLLKQALPGDLLERLRTPLRATTSLDRVSVSGSPSLRPGGPSRTLSPRQSTMFDDLATDALPTSCCAPASEGQASPSASRPPAPAAGHARFSSLSSVKEGADHEGSMDAAGVKSMDAVNGVAHGVGSNAEAGGAEPPKEFAGAGNGPPAAAAANGSAQMLEVQSVRQAPELSTSEGAYGASTAGADAVDVAVARATDGIDVEFVENVAAEAPALGNGADNAVSEAASALHLEDARKEHAKQVVKAQSNHYVLQ